ncbi:Virulence protein RhuM family protein [Tepidimonas sediminis]|uniref:Virulence protein RhuM family protein n=1 Tax=Tepidimonas sediminis TaxID=2588941 RepID=A0A554WUL8_9BURK|nr:RhuM family protein [Tepidimonas sediminis]TSE27280.1 Virulence protein RhuM family protein [Tepidimonas sediminis]
MKPASGIIIYDGGEARVEVRLERDTVWLTQEQMALLFGRERSVITKHIRNVFAEGELEREAVCAKCAHTASDGKTYQGESNNLDVIISVGYRVKSLQGTRFRQWATRVLREHLTRGYTLDRQRFEQNAALLVAKSDAKNKNPMVRLIENMPTLSGAPIRGVEP